MLLFWSILSGSGWFLVRATIVSPSRNGAGIRKSNFSLRAEGGRWQFAVLAAPGKCVTNQQERSKHQAGCRDGLACRRPGVAR